MTIARVALPVAADHSFDYWAPSGVALVPGSLVRVRLARRSLVGVVTDVDAESDVTPDRLQPLEEIVA
jgi:primosomal protein N' (replication factor Y)